VLSRSPANASAPKRSPAAYPTRPAASGRRAATSLARPAARDRTRLYVEALTGLRVGRDGKVACPFHPDNEPSLHAYPDHWTCYSAKCWRGDRPNGGDIYNLAAQLWFTGQSSDVPLRGRRFIEVRARLMDLFFGDGDAAWVRRRWSWR
jgi:hypothetical protein